MLSYFNRCAKVALSVRSLTATTSMSLPLAATARQKLRPMRPKPLTPTRMLTGSDLLVYVTDYLRQAAYRTQIGLDQVGMPSVQRRQKPGQHLRIPVKCPTCHSKPTGSGIRSHDRNFTTCAEGRGGRRDHRR